MLELGLLKIAERFVTSISYPLIFIVSTKSLRHSELKFSSFSLFLFFFCFLHVVSSVCALLLNIDIIKTILFNKK